MVIKVIEVMWENVQNILWNQTNFLFHLLVVDWCSACELPLELLRLHSSKPATSCWKNSLLSISSGVFALEKKLIVWSTAFPWDELPLSNKLLGRGGCLEQEWLDFIFSFDQIAKITKQTIVSWTSTRGELILISAIYSLASLSTLTERSDLKNVNCLLLNLLVYSFQSRPIAAHM